MERFPEFSIFFSSPDAKRTHLHGMRPCKGNPVSFVIWHLSFVIIPKPYNDLEGAKPRALAKKMTNDKWEMKENFAVCAPVSGP
jgi:hypothetical protein